MAPSKPTTVTPMAPASVVDAESAAHGSAEDSMVETAKAKAMEIKDRSIQVTEEGKKQMLKLIQQARDYRTTLANGPCGLKLYCFGACVATLVLTIMFEILQNLFNPFQLIVSLYAAIFALVGVILEGSTLPCKALDIKGPLEHWCKFLSRVWGRGLFYISIALLQFAQQTWVGWITGALLGAAGIMSFIVSIYGTRRLNATSNSLLARFGNKGDAAVREAFDAFDKNKSGTLNKAELALATDSLGSAFTPDQLTSVFELLDTDDSGEIDFDEFKAWWTNEKDVNYAWV